MRQRIRNAPQSFLPALALGLFCGRLLSELWVQQQRPMVGVHPLVVAVITAATALMAFFLLRKRQWRHLWPLLFLAIYSFFPEPYPRLTWTLAALVLTIFGHRLLGHWLARQKRTASTATILLLAGLFFLLYVVTLAADVLPADNGEFQLVAANLGVAHPPGFPLYTLLGHLMTTLPGAATPALKVNLLSAATSTLTLVLLYLIVFHLTAGRLAGITAVIALGTSTTFWSQATTSNIRSLTGLFAALAIYLALLFSAACHLQSSQNEPVLEMERPTIKHHPDHYLFLFVLALSSGIIHHASLLFIGLILVVFILVTDPSLLLAPRRWSKPFLAGLVSLLPLLYLPWRGHLAASGQSIRGASPSLVTWQGFLDHVLALGFRGDFFYFLDSGLLWERLKVMGNVLTFQFSPWLLMGMGLGLIQLYRQQRRIALLLAGSFAIHAFVTATYRAPQTVEYMLPAYLPAAICLGYGIAKAVELLPSTIADRQVVGQLFTAIMFVSALIQGIDHYPSFRYLGVAASARDYAQDLLGQAPQAAVMLADWHWTPPLWYLQEVEGRRPDVEVRFVFPTGEPYAETWVRRIRENYDQGRPVISTHFDEASFYRLPVPEPIGQAFLFRQQPRLSIPESFTPVDLTLGEAIQIRGYHLSQRAVQIGQEAVLTLAWQPVSALATPTSLFAHLVGQDDGLYAQHDQPAQPQAEGISLTQFHLVPRLGAVPGEYTILIGAYNQAPMLDESGQSRTAVASLAVQAMSRPLITHNSTYRQLIGTTSWQRLIGYDWDNTLPGQKRLYLHWQIESGFYSEVYDRAAADAYVLPESIGAWGIKNRPWSPPDDQNSHYVPFAQGIIWSGPLLPEEAQLRPGDSIWLRQTFESSWPITQDIATSVRLIGYDEDGRSWAWWDLDDVYGVPALGGIPTLKWIAGSTVSDVHQLSVDEAAYPGQIVGTTLGLYDAFTGQPLTILDQRFTREGAWRLTQVAPAN